jgi:DNA-binding beta-propeller fold protein YncE
MTRTGWVALTLAMTLRAAPLDAQIVVSANDGKVRMLNGATAPASAPRPDTVSVIDLNASPPKVLADLRAPVSVVGPPQSVAIAPDGSLALVTAAMQVDPADATKLAPDDKVTVIDLKASPPAVVGTVRAGRGASGVSFTPDGTLALVANRTEGTVSIFTIAGKTVTPAGKVDLNAPDSGPSHVAITPDGRTALVTRNNDSLISLLTIAGAKVEYAKRDLAAGFKPYSIEISSAGDVAVVGHIGAGPSGGTDTVALIDLRANPPRTVDQSSVGPTVEGVALSPDGRSVAATVMNGSNSPPGSPFFHDFGLVKILGISNGKLTPITEARVGHWCQGAAWSKDSRTLLVQCMTENEIQVFRFDGSRLTPGAAIKVSASPAGIRAAGR